MASVNLLYGAHNGTNSNPYYLGKMPLIPPVDQPGPYAGAIKETLDPDHRTLDIRGSTLLTAAMIYDQKNTAVSFVLQQYAIEVGGSLTQIGEDLTQLLTHYRDTHSVDNWIACSADHVYVADMFCIYIYAYGTNGLTYKGTFSLASTSSSIWGLKLDPSGQYLCLKLCGDPYSILACHMHGDQLEPLGQCFTQGNAQIADYAFSPDGSRMYVSAYQGIGWADFKNGGFTPNTITTDFWPSTVTNQALGLAISSSGKYLYVSDVFPDDGSDGEPVIHIQSFSLDPTTGAPTYLGQSDPLGNDGSAWSTIILAPDDTHIYAAGTGLYLYTYQVEKDGRASTQPYEPTSLSVAAGNIVQMKIVPVEA
ncbi:hypothetical protein AKI39_19480 [Bordetella sp. H567]|uniref:hypothetical protein n=1 Tax=Bordetella sp. H567 TaxID=1697043 RepID=UPI00081C865B|nr:hypothetical protein [Bordetella sp. H567]AOB32436.1 hypothetical protein AKI39_19480 [Bordetella sp. H567]